jgi:catechol 2,3-dioxygenase-like lactoylglutathione lyase family enzyme
MTSRIAQWTLDVHDLDLMATFWSQVLGYRIDEEYGGTLHLLPPGEAPPGTLTVWLQPAADDKTTKNRNHPDLRPDQSVEAEVARLLELGATYADVGQQSSDPFVVLRDPEGNEFCVLHHDQR